MAEAVTSFPSSRFLVCAGACTVGDMSSPCSAMLPGCTDRQTQTGMCLPRAGTKAQERPDSR